MAIDKVKEYFKPLHMEDHILEFDVSSATVELAAEALHCEEKRIAKTMSFLVGEQPILIVTAGDTKIDNVKIYLDESLRRFETVFPAAGSPNSAIELTIPELEKYSNFLQWVDVCKGWQEPNTI